MTRRHPSLFTPTYMCVVAVPGGSGTSCCVCKRPGGIRTLSPHARGLLGGGSHFPLHHRNQNYPGNFQAAAFHHETDFRSGSGHQVPQKRVGGGGKLPTAASAEARFLPLRSRGGKTAEPLGGMFHAATRMCKDPCNSPPSSALQQQTATFFFPDICPPKAIPSTEKKKGPGMHQIL